MSLARGLNACVPFWELPHLPAEWVDVLDAMDVVLAPTRFVKAACDEVLARPSVHYPQAVFVPADVTPDRQRWGFGDEQCVFLLAFDLQSDLQRKNPHAAIEAFARAFGDDAGALLAIKLNTARLEASQGESLAALRATVSERANVVLIEEHLSYRDVLSLYASCDVMVSTHRSEGLGLHLMEAMSLGRAVMATGWSGNMDFMTGGELGAHSLRTRAREQRSRGVRAAGGPPRPGVGRRRRGRGERSDGPAARGSRASGDVRRAGRGRHGGASRAGVAGRAAR